MKKCGNCKRKFSTSFFYKKKIGAKGNQLYHSYCKNCCSKKIKIYYQVNKERHDRLTANDKRRVRHETGSELIKYLLKHPCIDCGNGDIRVLEFDHVKGKKLMSVGSMRSSGKSWNDMKKEIEKCVVRCANCHRIKTGKEKDDYRSKFELKDLLTGLA